ncbi:MAG: trypsin-like peptidase domain-containing protein [Sphingobacteriales bacterium]|jgi:serine protease Do|nr:trypsin-like peptidase domain-containing protein [Sphingobacteriales bacterium]
MQEHDNTFLIEAVERYIMGEMNPDERLHFENLRKSDSEIDQMVVGHTLFMQKMNRYNEWQKFHKSLNEIHTNLSEQGKIDSIRLKGKAKVVYIYNRFKKTAAIAASIAGITTLLITSLFLGFSPRAPQSQVIKLSNDVKYLANKTHQQDKEINNLKMQGTENQPAVEIPYTKGGTGFMIDGKGYLVTNYHVVEKSKNIAVQNSTGHEYFAKIIYTDPSLDIAILKIDDPEFKQLPTIPYSFFKGHSDLATSVFTLGFPKEKEDIVYGQGFLSSRTGYNGDTLSCQLQMSANRGSSGSPILNQSGEVIAILNGRLKDAEGVAYGIESKNIFKALNELKKQNDGDSALNNLKLNSKTSLTGLSRTQQLKKIENYIFMVKVN